MSDNLTYPKLVDRVISYAERSDIPFTSLIPNFISLAENRISGEVKGLGTTEVVQFNTLPGESTYEKPARWRETRAIMIRYLGSWVSLFPRTYEYCRMYGDDEGTPEFYCDYDKDHILFTLTPDVAYQLEWSYYQKPKPLSDSNQTNWFTEYQPNMLLAATMVEACLFLKRFDRQEVFEGEYKKHVALFTQENSNHVTDNSVRRSK